MQAIEVVNVTKRFNDFVAIDHVSMCIEQGEIHAICGENGAGKSTLMNMLFGLLQPTEGIIKVNQEEKVFSSPKAAIASGIGMVHQHFKLVPSLKVYENVVLGEELTHHGYIRDQEEQRAVQQTIDKFGFGLDASAIVGELSVGEQQKVEIIKMLHRNVNILILDEPTAVLTPHETDELLLKLKGLKEEGKTIIIITHKLEEVMKVSDRVTVIRKGKHVLTDRIEHLTQQSISKHMVGRDVAVIQSQYATTSQETAFELQNVSFYTQNQKKVLDDISIHVHYGEVVGIAGIEGNGQSELVSILTGILKPSSGKFIYKNQEITDSSPLKLRELGFGLVPEDRYKDGLNAEMTIWENMVAGRMNHPSLCQYGFLNKKEIRQKTKQLVEEFDIRNCEDVNTKVSKLSGGNAQKIIMAREISCNPDVIVMSQPTRGVDIGSIEFIHSKILELKDKGKAVLIVSSELTEILNLSDRIYVMYKGKISGERNRKETTKSDIGMLMVGLDKNWNKGERT